MIFDPLTVRCLEADDHDVRMPHLALSHEAELVALVARVLLHLRHRPAAHNHHGCRLRVNDWVCLLYTRAQQLGSQQVGLGTLLRLYRRHFAWGSSWVWLYPPWRVVQPNRSPPRVLVRTKNSI